MAHCSGEKFEEDGRLGLNWKHVYPVPLAKLLPGRSLVAVRKRYLRLVRDAERGSVELVVTEHLGPQHDAESTDKKLWGGAWETGWRLHEPRENRYVYVHVDGRRYVTKKQVFETREGFMQIRNNLQICNSLDQGEKQSQLVADTTHLTEFDGYPLVPSFTNITGYKNVYIAKSQVKLLKPFQARCSKTGAEFGCFATAVEGALAYSKFLGKDKAAAEVIEMKHLSDRWESNMTVEEAEMTAKAEGLYLVRDANNGTGFRGVLTSKRCTKLPYLVKWTTGDRQTFGLYATIGAAALEYARLLGPKQSAAAAERAELFALRNSLGLENDRAWRKTMADMGVEAPSMAVRDKVEAICGSN